MNANDLRAERRAATLNDPRWHHVTRRDAAADGSFYYGIRTTGVYCRPSCAARTAKPENVAFHATQAAARQAGLRPCKRCKPEQRQPEQCAHRDREIANHDTNRDPTLCENAAAGDIRFVVGECCFGVLLVAASAAGLCAILIGDNALSLKQNLRHRFAQANLIGGDALLQQHLARVAMVVATPTMNLGLPLDTRGTAFQRRVWQALREIPVGVTRSYAEVAERIGSPKAVRAVAQACAANPLAVAIPCHRVVRSDGALSGYAWGVERKRMLLAREAQA